MQRLALIALASLLLAPAFAGAQPPAHRVTGDLAIRARHIFQKHCAGCHTGSPEPGASKLDLMDREQVVAKKTPVPLVTADGRSLILDLVKDGSMPPANRPGLTAEEVAVLEKWVNAAAPAYPPKFDEQTTLSAIASDFEGIVAKVKIGDPGEYTRYISFAHLIRDGQAVPNLAAAELRLNDALSLAAGHPFEAVPVNPTATLFRIDTSVLGWLTPEVFDKMDGLKPAGVARLQPFDLILMEYPHAQTLAAKDPSALRLEKLLARSSQVRPVPFVQGDWLTTALVQGKELTPLATDLRALGSLKTALGRGDPAPDGPVERPFAGAKPVNVPAALEGRVPLPPLSAWVAGDVTPAVVPFALKAELVVADKPVAGVKVDEAFYLRVTSDRKVHVTLLMIQADGEIRIQAVMGGTVVLANTPRLLAPKAGGVVVGGISGGGDTATEHFVLFASETELPLPTILRSKHADKHVWRFLLEPTEKDKFDPNGVVRKVIPISVTRK